MLLDGIRPVDKSINNIIIRGYKRWPTPGHTLRQTEPIRRPPKFFIAARHSLAERSGLDINRYTPRSVAVSSCQHLRFGKRIPIDDPDRCLPLSDTNFDRGAAQRTDHRPASSTGIR